MARIWNEEKINTRLKPKVVLAMSGGIDSSVAAALLKKQGYDAIGVFMKFWSPLTDDSAGTNRCCSVESEVRARLVAKKLGIPFYVFNFEKEFKKRIVEYFLLEYKKGNTPNPCVVCNKEIKFGLLLEKAFSMGADYIATGHYARVIQNSKLNKFKLFLGKDRRKDQSYFLWQLTQNQLQRVLFPVGGFTKDQVKGLAKKFKLPFRKVQESMDVCFIQTTVNDFLRSCIKNKPGDIIDSQGKKIGMHQGLWFHTIGQRKGLGLAGGPYFVKGKDFKKNLLVVTSNKKDLLSRELTVKMVNWISGKAPEFPLHVMAKIRYRHKLSKATITGCSKSHVYSLKFSRLQSAVTPGQSVVFYGNNELLGGGIIC